MVAATAIKRQIKKNQLARGSAADKVNVGDTERLISAGAGALLAVIGLREGDIPGLCLATFGGALVYRGLSGHCPMYGALDINTDDKHGRAAAVAAGRGVKVVHAVTIQNSAAELYQHWHNFENLPRFMHHLVSVTTNGNRSHWVARAPVGITVEWDAEIVNDEFNRLIAWRSLEGSQIATAGSVHFNGLSHGRGTEVKVILKYDPPAGKLGAWIAWAFGQDPSAQVREDLRCFKQLMETGEVATARGKSSSRR